MTMKLADDCFFHDKDRMPHDEALAILKSRVRPVVDVESIDCTRLRGAILPSPSERHGTYLRTTTPQSTAMPSTIQPIIDRPAPD